MTDSGDILLRRLSLEAFRMFKKIVSFCPVRIGHSLPSVQWLTEQTACLGFLMRLQGSGALGWFRSRHFQHLAGPGRGLALTPSQDCWRSSLSPLMAAQGLLDRVWRVKTRSRPQGQKLWWCPSFYWGNPLGPVDLGRSWSLMQKPYFVSEVCPCGGFFSTLKVSFFFFFFNPWSFLSFAMELDVLVIVNLTLSIYWL